VEGIGCAAPQGTCVSLNILIPKIRYGYFFVSVPQEASQTNLSSLLAIPVACRHFQTADKMILSRTTTVGISRVMAKHTEYVVYPTVGVNNTLTLPFLVLLVSTHSTTCCKNIKPAMKMHSVHKQATIPFSSLPTPGVQCLAHQHGWYRGPHLTSNDLRLLEFFRQSAYAHFAPIRKLRNERCRPHVWRNLTHFSRPSTTVLREKMPAVSSYMTLHLDPWHCCTMYRATVEGSLRISFSDIGATSSIRHRRTKDVSRDVSRQF
jgi:hypothetical protein